MSFNKRYTLYIKENQKECYICGNPITLSNSTLDHVVAKSKGGKETKLSCRTCNRMKDDLDFTEFIKHCKNIIEYQFKTNIMSVPMHPVQSSNLTYIRYDSEKKALYVTFKNGITYRYDNVSEDTYEEFKNNSSIGKYFIDNIKDNYPYSKI